MTRKQRLCQRHRAPLDRYIFISISRMFLKLYRRETSHMGHIFHNDVLAYTLENARPTWYRVNWNAPVCFARANRSPMRELYSEKKDIRDTHMCDATEKEQELIIDYGVEKSSNISHQPCIFRYSKIICTINIFMFADNISFWGIISSSIKSSYILYFSLKSLTVQILLAIFYEYAKKF